MKREPERHHFVGKALFKIVSMELRLWGMLVAGRCFNTFQQCPKISTGAGIHASHKHYALADSGARA